MQARWRIHSYSKHQNRSSNICFILQSYRKSETYPPVKVQKWAFGDMCREYKFNISCTKWHSVCCIATGIHCRKTIWNFFFFSTRQATINPSHSEKQNIHSINTALATNLTKETRLGTGSLLHQNNSVYSNACNVWRCWEKIQCVRQSSVLIP